jgi:hypothetical protein
MQALIFARIALGGDAIAPPASRRLLLAAALARRSATGQGRNGPAGQSKMTLPDMTRAAQFVVPGTAVYLLSCHSHYLPPVAWIATGHAHKQGPRHVNEHFALLVKVSGWPAETRSGYEMQLRLRSRELTAVRA